MSEFQRRLKELAKSNRITKEIFLKMKENKLSKGFKIEDIIQIDPQFDPSDKPRINVILITLQKHAIYGGVSTAIKFFQGLDKDNCYEKRIIVQSPEKYSQDLTYAVNGYGRNSEDNGIFFLAEGNKLPVRDKDLFITTGWKTAYIIPDILAWQDNMYGSRERKHIYLIQDYEPGFSPWSSLYGLAESTYLRDAGNTIAVFNSKELYDFFENRNYQFAKSYYFQPSLNPTLKDVLLSSSKPCQRERIILVYGRPSFNRNAFEVIRYGLNLWSRAYDDANKWKIISLGESFQDIALENGVVIHSYGKAELEQYAQLMRKAYIGISLMVSPHPSYPPLEMATFGIKTITNLFENKDLSSFSPNIVNIEYISPKLLAQKISLLTESYSNADMNNYINREYIEGTSFNRTTDLVDEELRSLLLV